MLVHLMQIGEDVTSAAISLASGGPEHMHTPLWILTTDDDDDDAVALESPVTIDVSSKFNFREQWQKFDGDSAQLRPGAGDTGDVAVAGSVVSTGLCLSQ